MPVALKVDDRKWRKLVADVKGVDKLVVKVGVLGGVEADGTSLPLIAAVHEYGSDTLPERSFIRRTFDARADDLSKMCERCARSVVLNGMPVPQALGLIGAWGAAAVKRTITSNEVKPPDAPSTIAAKGSSTTLVDTGQLVNAVTWSVAERSGSGGAE